MAMKPSAPARRGPPALSLPLPPAALKGGGWGLLVLLILVGIPGFVWFFCRIEPGAGEIAILTAKTGEDLPSGQILALQSGQKGILLDVLPEGRYFRDPYHWDWQIAGITDIPAGRLGVLTRLYGQGLPPGQIIAGADQKGIVAEVLRPGKYRINPYAYAVELFDAISIRPGSVGVVTSLVGKGVLNDELPAQARNLFLVGEGMKGVVPEVLDPGTYYLNPYLVNVVEVNLQSQRFEMSGDDAITFFTLDGFTVRVEGTIEFNIARDKAALLTHRVGDMEDVLKKIILPRARGFSRIEGSKHPAINFIIGETRQQFQDNLETHLRQQAEEWGVSIRSVLIRNILPPDQIASVIREREVAVLVADLESRRVDNTVLFKLLKQEHPGTLVIVTTKASDSELIISLINEARIFRFVNKPVNLTLLQSHIVAALERYHSFKQAPALIRTQKAVASPEIVDSTAGRTILESLRAIGGRFTAVFRG